MPVPRLHLIGPLGGLSAGEYVAVAASAVLGGVDAVHVRMPGAATADLLGVARSLRDCIGGAALIVNDRLDVALITGAGGVQLGERSFTVADARTLLGRDALIGRSVHDLAGALQAESSGADYLLAGHVYDTPSKAGTPGRGLEWLARMTAVITIPVIALGGISIERIPDVIEAGAHGVAMGRELSGAGVPSDVAEEAVLAIEHGLRAAKR
jgi:thiamine-phosphate diphosphorylase